LMKKGRPGTVLHVLAAANEQERLAGIVFAETTTFGLRVLPVGRLYAEERRETVRIAGHDIGVRLGYAQGRLATVSPEYEDCRRAAAELGRPVRVVYEAAQASCPRPLQRYLSATPARAFIQPDRQHPPFLQVVSPGIPNRPPPLTRLTLSTGRLYNPSQGSGAELPVAGRGGPPLDHGRRPLVLGPRETRKSGNRRRTR
ncbi:MAG: DUF111 family protein, partial [Actinomycetota bacterium]